MNRNKIILSENEFSVLKILAGIYLPDEWGAYGFLSLSRITKLEIKEVREACRSLATKGYSAYERSLWNDDGPAGAGYRATEEGAAFISPCDVCGARSVYEYEKDDRGLSPFDKGFSREKSKKIRECDEHYKKSNI